MVSSAGIIENCRLPVWDAGASRAIPAHVADHGYSTETAL